MELTNSHPIDMLLYRDEYGSPEMRAVFSEENIIKKWLLVYAAIAEVEGELEIIPSEAAEEIKKKATGNYVKVSRVGPGLEAEIDGKTLSKCRMKLS